MHSDKIRKQTDGSLINSWAESGRDVYAVTILLRYLPMIYGVCLCRDGDAARARDDARAFSAGFSSLLSGYETGSDFASWLYVALLGFLRSRTSGKTKKGLTPQQKAFLRQLGKNDESAVSVFESGADKLSKPQRESMRLFFTERETFEGIARRTGYLTEKIRDYIKTGAAALADTENGAETGVSHAGEYSTAYLHYLKGSREDSAAHAIELESMTDQFLSDAVEGCLKVDDDHARYVAELEREIEAGYFPPRNNKTWIYLSITALIVIAGVGAYFYFTPPRQEPDGKSAGYESQGTPDAEAADYGLPPEETPEEIGDFERDTSVDAVDKPAQKEAEVTGVETERKGDETVVEAAERHSGPVSLISVSKDTDPDGKEHYTSLPMIGRRAYDEYLGKATVELEGEVSGDVTLTFDVNRYGRPSRIRVTGYLTPEAHREAIRLLENGPEWSLTDRQVTITLRFE